MASEKHVPEREKDGDDMLADTVSLAVATAVTGWVRCESHPVWLGPTINHENARPMRLYHQYRRPGENSLSKAIRQEFA